MPRLSSVAISDFILALVSYSVTGPLFRHSRTLASLGFLIVAVAASLGSLKFALSNPPASLVRYHAHASWLASVVGVSLIAVDYHVWNRFQSRSFTSLAILLVLALPVVIFARAFNIWSKKVDVYVTDAIGGLAIASLLLSSIIYPNGSCLFGSVMYVAGGLIGTQGFLYGLRRVDWFHYLLAFGNIGFYLALRYKPDPLFFKSR